MPHSESSSRPPSILRHESHEVGQVSASPKGYFGLNGGQSSTPKSVSIAPETEVISPLILGNQKDVDELDLEPGRTSRKQSLVKRPSSRRLVGRPPSTTSPVLRSKSSLYISSGAGDERESSTDRSQSRHSGHHVEHLIDQVTEWIKEERAKHAQRKAKRHPSAKSKDDKTVEDHVADEEDLQHKEEAQDEPAESFDLDKLESIIKNNLNLERPSTHSRHSIRRKLSALRHRKPSTASSDTDQLDNEVIVPTCDVVLDNSKTLSYTGGDADDSGVSSSDELERSISYRDRDAWSSFKFEIVRLSHTLRLKGWRRVSMEMSDQITVERLSGALTNAVYVVSPPEHMPPPSDRGESDGTAPASSRPPPKLLMRIYGPQVGHLIDREAELAILRRLCKQNIGPRLLGTFANGRFEEYLYAKPLTPEELRNPDTSRQIAKRMRELHEGIELLNRERDDGPFVWRNWDKWLQRVEQVVTWLDQQVMELEPGAKPIGPDAWKRRGFICGAPWKQFREMVEKYRKWLYGKYGGAKHVREQLVFAHNDTQYGNILRVIPTGESPLMLPANSHKQLIVIDFEYASANLVGLEFANHFTEWCYNYHDARKPYAFHPKRYPTPEEQDRFIRAYVRHRPQFNVSTPKVEPATPQSSNSNAGETPIRRPTSSISDFMLDARTPPVAANSQSNEEASQKAAEDQEVARFMRETRMWRLANTVQWVAWGVIQAKVPGMPDFGESKENKEPRSKNEEALREDLGERGEEYRELGTQEQQNEDGEVSEKEEVEEEFNYLGYAQHRALFFWADAIQLGLVKAEDLPEELREKVKKVPY